MPEKLRKNQNVFFLGFVIILALTIRIQGLFNDHPSLLNIVAAQFISDLQELFHRLNTGRKIVLLWLCLTIVGSGLYTVAFAQIYSIPDTRITASNWIKDNIPKCSHILVENDSPYVPPLEYDGQDYYQISKLDFGYLYKSSDLALNSYIPAIFKVFNEDNITRRGKEQDSSQNFELLTDEQKWQYINEKTEYVDYVIFSDRHYSVYKNLGTLFPVEANYYAGLFNGGLGSNKLKCSIVSLICLVGILMMKHQN